MKKNSSIKKIFAILLTSFLLTGCSLFNPDYSDIFPNEPTDPTDPVNPDPVDPDPEDPVDPDPEDPVNPDPVDPDPVDPVDPVDPDPEDPVDPVDPVDPDPDVPEEPEEIEPYDSIQDMNILHAWDWKLNDIKARLNQIRHAGYGAIQISPMQPEVDKGWNPYDTTKSQWWKLYQPLGFQIAGSNENVLGTKIDLVSLCKEADKYGIKIVVDIVSNHLAGSASGYSNQVYKQYPLHSYVGGANDNDRQSVVQGNIGLPDIDTSNTEMQADVISMLKEYLDCGVDGFRFDAAKHIETPDDGDWASNYWPNVLNSTTAYAASKGYDTPYYYGEILNTCGAGRSFSSYTEYMSVIDNKQGEDIFKAVDSYDWVSASKSTFNTGEDADHLVLWAESHDTYANEPKGDSFNTYSKDNDLIKRVYAVQASRKDTATLYFARPTNLSVTMCSIDDNSGWQDDEVRAINLFHRRYNNKSEHIYYDNECFINVRGTGEFAGAAIVNFNINTTVNVNVSSLEDGEYTDLVTNKNYTVSNGKVTIAFYNDCAVLIPKGADTGLDESEVVDDGYYSSVVLENYDSSKSYLAWVWNGSSSGYWKAFSVDHSAIGLSLNSGDNYIIVEFPSGTTTSSANWSNKIKQTNDLVYSGSQQILNYNDLVWK